MGILLGLISAVGVAASKTITKSIKELHATYISWIHFLAALPVIALAVTLLTEWVIPPLTFFILLILIILPIESLVAYMRVRALQLSDISLVAPLDAFTSIFLIPLGFFILNETPSAVGVAGILIIFSGSFFLSWQYGMKFKRSLLVLVRDKGAIISIVSSALITISIVVTKQTFALVEPILVAFYVVLGLVFTMPLFKLSSFTFKNAGKEKKKQAYLALTSGIGIITHFIGLSIFPAAYFISIKRVSMVINVFTGKIFFQEKHFKTRLIGALLMVGGIALIAVS